MHARTHPIESHVLCDESFLPNGSTRPEPSKTWSCHHAASRERRKRRGRDARQRQRSGAPQRTRRGGRPSPRRHRRGSSGYWGGQDGRSGGNRGAKRGRERRRVTRGVQDEAIGRPNRRRCRQGSGLALAEECHAHVRARDLSDPRRDDERRRTISIQTRHMHMTHTTTPRRFHRTTPRLRSNE